ncbi:hypothetical protein PV10_06399 [Exophiala mesophila]|uniref:Uncharacterized protein n=1 Tax=Exophiala mesophila TaxID=212818 RepID=A0A0D1ZDA1_EXOME|nr:uncharacterized protein PV10_06399 [Exophiala mesophila]KIV91909.1 hypothetical protein PV10_06399 [Exophiala mesophila]
MKGAPKLRALSTIIADVIVQYELKLLIFTTIPGQLVLIIAILRALKVKATPWVAGMSHDARLKVRVDFNGITEPEGLIGSFATMACGLNLQKRCHWVVFLDPPPSEKAGNQAGSLRKPCLLAGGTHRNSSAPASLGSGQVGRGRLASGHPVTVP